MDAFLLKSFQFRTRDVLPYRKDGYGGFVFHGVGSHILWSDLRNRWYRFAFEIATVDQPVSAVLEQSRLILLDGNAKMVPKQSILEWKPACKRDTRNPRYSSYQWCQDLEIDDQDAELVTIRIELLFSSSKEWIPVKGDSRVLVDMHPGDPPPYYGRFNWYLRRILALGRA